MSAPNDSSPPFATSALWQRLVNVSRQALLTGHLQPISTRAETLVDGNSLFNVRVLEHLQRKAIQRKKQTRDFNPFLPFEQPLFVANVSDQHVALLNKFNVVDHHLLIVTREFESQDSRLNLNDFRALWRCLLEFESLGFYNAGTVAGASQPHKHLQLLPLGNHRGAVSLEPLFDLQQQPIGTVTQAVRLPFWHRLVRLPAISDADEAAEQCCQLYGQVLKSVGWANVSVTTPYNLLVTREWLLFVPRTAECFESISLNSMAFVGSLFVKSQQQLEALRAAGPMAALRSVANPTHDTQA